jgi:uncharacterized protein (TIGR03435 family)
MALAGLFLCPLLAFAQAPATPAFEVASIKVSMIGKAGGEGSRRENIETGPGSLTMRNVSMTACLRWAYDVQDYQISGPGWMGIERYDIVAKAGSPAKDPELKLMLQTLLADRFKLTLHSEEKVLPAYILTVAKNGPKFHESQSEGKPEIQGTKMAVTAQRVPMSMFVEMLGRALQSPILDQTGLKGRYDVALDIGDYISRPVQREELPALIAGGIQDMLGLKLEPKKTPLQVLVVDRAEKVPTEN